MQYFPPIAAILALVSFFDNGHVLGNNLQIQVSRMMEELLDLKENFAELQKDIVNVRRDLNQDHLDQHTLIGKLNETICHCPREGGGGRKHELSSPNADEKYARSSLLNSEDLKKLDMMLKGLAKEKAIRINFGKKLDIVEDTHGQNLLDLTTNIENLEKRNENRLSAKIKATEVAFGIKLDGKVSMIEWKLQESLSKINQTIENLHVQIEKWRLDREVPQCEDGWREFQGSCYSVIHSNMSWLSAEQYCQAFNSHLIRIDNHTEFQFIQGILNELHQIALKKGIQLLSTYWTAGNDIMQEGHWVWTPRNVPIRYNAWSEHEPNNSEGNEDCAHIDNYRQFKMNDLNCEWKLYFICEIDRTNG